MIRQFLTMSAIAACMTTSQIAGAQDSPNSQGDKNANDWISEGDAALAERLKLMPNTKRAKNVILFVGDGMGISTLTAGRILEGQLRGEPGEENLLSFETFPYTALVKTYNTDAQVADSAGTASALNTGSKTRIGVINTGPNQPAWVCEGAQDNLLMPLAYYAEKAGLSTGIVSTARLTHATPAAVYAHSPARGWESDADLTDEAREHGCTDIASQILGDINGDGLEVALGGGREKFLPEAAGGERLDGRDLTQEWANLGDKAAYVSTQEELRALDLNKTDRLLGLFNPSHLRYEAERDGKEPDLAELTETAIKMLERDEDGYYLMVEAGRIDHGHHAGSAVKALHDTVALSKAVKRALEMVDTEETLILVTADHSHVFTVAGYPKRGNPIFGLVVPPHSDEPEIAEDGKPYTTLGYQNGPGAALEGGRAHLTMAEAMHPDHRQQALVPKMSETHGGEDVALFAVGPWAHLVRGTIEQNLVFHIMDHALGLRDRTSD